MMISTYTVTGRDKSSRQKSFCLVNVKWRDGKYVAGCETLATEQAGRSAQGAIRNLLNHHFMSVVAATPIRRG